MLSQRKPGQTELRTISIRYLTRQRLNNQYCRAKVHKRDGGSFQEVQTDRMLYTKPQPHTRAHNNETCLASRSEPTVEATTNLAADPDTRTFQPIPTRVVDVPCPDQDPYTSWIFLYPFVAHLSSLSTRPNTEIAHNHKALELGYEGGMFRDIHGVETIPRPRHHSIITFLLRLQVRMWSVWRI